MYQSTRPSLQSVISRLTPALAFVLTSLRPDFYRSSEIVSTTGNKPNKIAYLNGLRGIASLLVYLSHHEGYAHPDTVAFQRAWGFGGHYYFSCLPGIRLLFNGGSYSVALFFVISGYVLARSSLKMIHNEECLRLAKHLGVAVPRRFVRLYFPMLCTTFAFMTSWHLFGIQASNTVIRAPEPTYVQEIWKWIGVELKQTFVLNIRDFNGFNPYNTMLLNITQQFQGSLLTYLVLLCMLAFAHYPHKMRLGAMVGLIFYFLFLVDGYYLAMIITGVLLCDIDLLTETQQLPSLFAKLNPLVQGGWIYYLLFAFALYLGGAPRVNDAAMVQENDPGWYYIAALVPGVMHNAKWFFQYWAATFGMISIPRIPWVRAFFELSFCQYLGKISFGMYLIHGPVLWTLGDRVYAAVGRSREITATVAPWWIDHLPISGAGPLGLEINYLAANVVLLPITMYIAGIVKKLFDEPSAQLAKWLFDPSRYDDASTLG